MVTSAALFCVGLGLTGYETYLSLLYVAVYRDWSAAHDRFLECTQTEDDQVDKVTQKAREWLRAHQDELDDLLRAAKIPQAPTIGGSAAFGDDFHRGAFTDRPGSRRLVFSVA